MPPVSLNSSNIRASHVEVVCNFAAGEVGHWYHLRKPCEVDAETLWRPTIVGFLAKIDIPSHSQRPPSPGETPWFVPAMTWNVRMNGGGCNLKQRHKKGWRRKGRTKNTQNFGLQKWDHEIHRFLMIFIYFYNVQNGMLHWVGLLCFYVFLLSVCARGTGWMWPNYLAATKKPSRKYTETTSMNLHVCWMSQYSQVWKIFERLRNVQKKSLPNADLTLWLNTSSDLFPWQLKTFNKKCPFVDSKWYLCRHSLV